MRPIVSNTINTSLMTSRNTYPKPIATPDHSAAPTTSNTMNFHSGTRTTPAIDVATDANPGMNLATVSETAPKRMKIDSVWRTHESGDSDTRQMVFSTLLP